MLRQPREEDITAARGVGACRVGCGRPALRAAPALPELTEARVTAATGCFHSHSHQIEYFPQSLMSTVAVKLFWPASRFDRRSGSHYTVWFPRLDGKPSWAATYPRMMKDP